MKMKAHCSTERCYWAAVLMRSNMGLALLSVRLSARPSVNPTVLHGLLTKLTTKQKGVFCTHNQNRCECSPEQE